MQKLDFGASGTPLMFYPELSALLGKKFYVKRDDMCGARYSSYSTGKLRKLEYIMAEAVALQTTSIIVSGNCQSNHARQLAMCCSKLGIKVHCVYQNDTEDTSSESLNSGNVLLAKLYGASTYLVGNADTFIGELLHKLRQSGETVYISTRGGSNSVGDIGYYEAFYEIYESLPEKVVDIYVCSGSGGTHAGLHLAAQTTDFKVIGVPNKRSIADQAIVVNKCGEALAETLGKGWNSELNFSEVPTAYGCITTEIFSTIQYFLNHTGIMLDPVYTVKTAIALLKDIEHSSAESVVLINGGEPVNTFAYRGQYEKHFTNT